MISAALLEEETQLSSQIIIDTLNSANFIPINVGLMDLAFLSHI